jgi:hypothetical protein
MGKFTVFWQTEHNIGVFSTGTENKELSGFSGIDRDTGKGKGARIGYIFPLGEIPEILDLTLCVKICNGYHNTRKQNKRL